MIHSSCRQCGGEIDEATGSCPVCGMLPTGDSVVAENTPQHDERLQGLLTQADEYQQKGDLKRALHLALKALLLRPDCSKIHAKLGHLYEQMDNPTAAHQHFQAALHMPPADDAVDSGAPLPPTPREALRHSGSGWLTWVLIGCVLCSGLAFLFTMMPDERHADRATVFKTPIDHPQLPGVPHWVWKTAATPRAPQPPAPAPDQDTDNTTTTAEPQPAPQSVPPMETPHPIVPAPRVEAPVTPAPAVLPVATPPEVIGPSAHSQIHVAPGGATIEEADKAYFCGQYEQAVSVFEELLRQEDHPNPRLYQDLAWCYQQLGNSGKATEHLTRAIERYKLLLVEEPKNSAAQQGLASCEAALNTLLTSREQPPSPVTKDEPKSKAPH